MNHHESESWAAVAMIFLFGLLILVGLVGGGAYWLYQVSVRARIAEALAIREAQEARMAEQVARRRIENARRARMVTAEDEAAQAAAANAPAREGLDQLRQCVSAIEDTWKSVEQDGELTGEEKTQMGEALDQLRSAVGALSL